MAMTTVAASSSAGRHADAAPDNIERGADNHDRRAAQALRYPQRQGGPRTRQSPRQCDSRTRQPWPGLQFPDRVNRDATEEEVNREHGETSGHDNAQEKPVRQWPATATHG